MCLITQKRWLARSWGTSHIDASAATADRPEAGIVAWGLPLRKRFAGEWLRTHKALDGGRRFDLSANAALEWRHVAAAQLAGLDLDGGGYLKERIVLDRRPATNRWDFDLEAPAGSRFALQPALTPEEAERGARRPEAVVGSYALFGPGGEKLAHVLRPFAQDAAGRRTWLTLDLQMLSPTLARMAIWAPQTLLDDAVYPVVIDPTFGYTSIGGSQTSNDANWLLAVGPYVPASDGTMTSLSIYGRWESTPGNVTMGLYNQSGGNPSQLVVDTAGVPLPQAAGWTTAGADTPAAITGGASYYVAWNRATRQVCYYDYCDTVEGYQSQAYVDGALPSTWGGGPLSRPYRWSLYATYTQPLAAKTPWHLFLCGRGS